MIKIGATLDDCGDPTEACSTDDMFHLFVVTASCAFKRKIAHNSGTCYATAFRSGLCRRPVRPPRADIRPLPQRASSSPSLPCRTMVTWPLRWSVISTTRRRRLSYIGLCAADLDERRPVALAPANLQPRLGNTQGGGKLGCAEQVERIAIVSVFEVLGD